MAITAEQILCIAQLYHLNWRRMMETRECHHPSKHEGGAETRCVKCNDNLVEWEKLSSGEHDTYNLRVSMFLESALKAGLEIAPEGTQARAGATLAAGEAKLEEIIREFVKKVKHPKGVAELFPSEELAIRIARSMGGDK